MRPENIADVGPPSSVSREEPLQGVRDLCALSFNLDQSQALCRQLELRVFADACYGRQYLQGANPAEIALSRLENSTMSLKPVFFSHPQEVR